MSATKKFETPYEHCLFYGYRPGHMFCYYLHSTLDNLTKTIAKTVLSSRKRKYVNLIENNHSSWKIYWALDSIALYKRPQGNVPPEFIKDIRALEDRGGHWPEVKNKIEKLFKKHSLTMSQEIRQEIAEADEDYVMTFTGKNRYALADVSGKKEPKIEKYFDNQIDVIEHILSTSFEESRLLVGDENIAKFLRSKNFKSLRDTPKFSGLAEEILIQVDENKWVLPKANEVRWMTLKEEVREK